MVLKMTKLQMPTLVSVLLLVAVSINPITAHAQLVSNFYNAKCPNAENLITIAVLNAYNSNRANMPGVLRMHFHDCFVHVRRIHQLFFSSSLQSISCRTCIVELCGHMYDSGLQMTMYRNTPLEKRIQLSGCIIWKHESIIDRNLLTQRCN